MDPSSEVRLTPCALTTREAAADVRRVTLASAPTLAELLEGIELEGIDREQGDALRLAEAVRVHAGRVLATLGFDPSEPALLDGMLRWDALFAGYVAALGARGAEPAAIIRRRSSELWLDASGGQLRLYHTPPRPRLWGTAPPRYWAELASPEGLWWLWRSEAGRAPRWFRTLADVVWETEVRPALARERATVAPALLRPIAHSVARMRPPRVADGRLVDAQGESVMAALVPLEVLQAEGLRALGSVLAPRVLEWQAAVLWRRATAGDQSATVDVVGGWEALAEQLGGGGSDRARKELPSLIAALTRVRFRWDAPAGYGDLPLLTGYHLIGAAKGRPAVLRLHLSPLFWPNTINRLQLEGGQRRLVPIVPEPAWTRQAVRSPLWAAAARLHRAGVGALVSGTDEQRRRGYVTIPWEQLADPELIPHLPKLLASAEWREVWEPDVAGVGWRLRPERPENAPGLRLLADFVPRRGRPKR